MKSIVGLARRVIGYEVSLYRSLYRWVAKRPDVPAGGMAFGYIGAISAVLWTFVVLSALELVGLHLLIPWETVRIVVDVLSLWGLIWMVGFMASMRVYPHVVTDAGLRIRHGSRVDFTVPWDAVASVGVRECSVDSSRTVKLDRDELGTVLRVVVGSRTNVDLELLRPLEVRLPKGVETVTEIRLLADDPRGLAGRAREYATAGSVNKG